MPGQIQNRRVVLSGPRYTSTALAFFKKVESQGGGFSSAEKSDISNLTRSLNLSQFGRLWYHAVTNSGGNRIGARTSIVNSNATPITEINSPTHTAGQGYTGDGATTALNTNYGSGSVIYTQNDISFGTYIRNNVQSNIVMGMLDAGATSENYIWPRFTDDNSYFSANGMTTPASAASTDSRGLLVSRRMRAIDMQGFKNGVQTANANVASTVPPAADFYILSSNREGTGAVNFSSAQVAMSFIGLGSMDQAATYTVIQQFAVARGFGIIP